MSSSPSAVLALAFSPDGRNLASTQCLEELFDRGENPYCNLHELLIWDTASGNIVQTLGVDYSINITQQTSEATEQTSDIVGHTDYIRALAFSPNENFLATGSDDQTIMIWDLETQLPLVLPLTQHKAPVTSMAFSPDGLMLASGSQDMNLILWDIPNFQSIGEPLTGAQGSILSLDFSADSAVLLSGDSGGALLAWDVWPDSWVERNCQQAGRNLSTTEWKQFFPDLPYSVTCPEWPGES
jgi:WD40 repeat protein